MEKYSREWKIKHGAWVQDHQAFDTTGMPCKIWKIHYIRHDTEYSVGEYFTKKSALEDLPDYK